MVWLAPALLCVCAACWLLSRYSHFRRARLPFIPPWPVVGNMGAVALRQTPFHDLAAHFYRSLAPHRCGGLFTFTTPVLLTRDPQLIGLLFAKEFDHFTDRQELIPETADPLFGKSLFGLQGQRWRDMRRILSPAFTPNKMRNMVPLIQEIGHQMRDYLANEMKEGGESITLEAKDFFSRISNDVIASTAFGVRINSLVDRNNDFYSMGKEVTDFGPRKSFIIFGYLLFPKLMEALDIKFMRDKCYKFFTSLIMEAIAQRERQNVLRHDMVHLLMQASKGELQDTSDDSSSNKKSSTLQDIDLAAQAMIFIFGGSDTISNLMSFTAHLLAKHQEVQQKLHQEIDELLHEKHDKGFTYEDVAACKYLDMVISESLRLYPPFAVMARKCVKAYKVPESETGEPAINVNPGDILWFPIFGLHADPELFPNPELFDPERFSDDRKKLIKPYSYIPFGVGPRFCIANRFALMEAKVLLIYLLSQFTIEPSDRTPSPLKFTATGFSLMVDGGLWLSIKPRN
ncbi:cytochrome P450 9e2-like isoform X3 [Schistocerca piceifrons]|uniref:cytochrome P450 9e2-like isoform X3 n=1 Tax=Schistocerca piceifrons TaxID=274613 RepID=UPI001F5FA404|nr:cytochrome P450 9e2-like isoform X3 [Schistocerca piceifrons]